MIRIGYLREHLNQLDEVASQHDGTFIGIIFDLDTSNQGSINEMRLVNKIEAPFTDFLSIPLPPDVSQRLESNRQVERQANQGVLPEILIGPSTENNPNSSGGRSSSSPETNEIEVIPEDQVFTDTRESIFQFFDQELSIPEIVFFPIEDIKLIAAYSERVYFSGAVSLFGNIRSQPYWNAPIRTLAAQATANGLGEESSEEEEEAAIPSFLEESNGFLTLKAEGDRSQLIVQVRDDSEQDVAENQRIGIPRIVPGDPCPPFWDPYMAPFMALSRDFRGYNRLVNLLYGILPAFLAPVLTGIVGLFVSLRAYQLDKLNEDQLAWTRFMHREVYGETADQRFNEFIEQNGIVRVLPSNLRFRNPLRLHDTFKVVRPRNVIVR